MTEYWIVYGVSDGTVRWTGSGGGGASAAAQEVPEGLAVLQVPQAVVATNPVDLDALKTYFNGKIDAAVGALRQQFITDVPGQSETYYKKETEARSWTDGDEVAHPEKYPFMLAEASVRSVPISQVQSEIMAQVNALVPIAASIEAHRVAAKSSVLAASTLPTIMTAATVDWQAVANAAAAT